MSAVRSVGSDGVERVLAALPSSVVVLDRLGRVIGLNDRLAGVVGLSGDVSFDAKVGKALSCMCPEEDGEQCGSRASCATCDARRLLQQALATGYVCRGRTAFKVGVNGSIVDLALPLSAMPIDLDDDGGAVLVIGHFGASVAGDRLSEPSWHGLVGGDPRMVELFETIRRVAPIDVPVLIHGESGSGKELVATALHEESRRKERPFVPVSCAALPEGLLESELFGHVRGAFTGATRDKKGRFELADGGTLFLDEIGELSPAMQVKLLRVLQTRSFERVGGEKTISVDVRVVSATNKDLEAEVAAGRFRADLYYRLCVVPIAVPALRERRGDILLLAGHLLRQWAVEHGRDPLPFSPAAEEELCAHSWPGNVRELDNAVRFAMVHCRGAMIEVSDLPPGVRGRPAPHRRAKSFRGLDDHAVSAALRSARGNRTRAAKALRVSRATLYRFLAERPGLTAPAHGG